MWVYMHICADGNIGLLGPVYCFENINWHKVFIIYFITLLDLDLLICKFTFSKIIKF